jgi:phosphoribosylformylglycinamidine synthase
VKLSAHPTAEIVPIRDASDEDLAVIGKKGIANADGSRRGPLALDLAYMNAIQSYFASKGRDPTDVELESIAQTWSEHCKHTIFADPLDELSDGLFKHYIKAATREIRIKKGDADNCVSVFSDNAGALSFDDEYLITHKVETHNSPSALDLYGGAITGIVGVNRDAMGFGLGAKPVANVYGFCFADPADEALLYRAPDRQQPMLSPRRIMDGVIDGVKVGGNCSGIPTPQGFLYFDSRYKGKPLVFVGTVGLIPRHAGARLLHQKKAHAGDLIVMAGGRVGQDGIHGATFSSEALDSGSPATAVQIGDPITQKKMSDALVKEARDLDLFSSITDNGAGGLSCSVAEMARECDGCRVRLDAVPLKYPNLEPWKIWISESQERMTLSVPPEKWDAFSDLMNRRGVEATIIGEFTDSGRCVVEYNGQTVMDVELEFLHNGLPSKQLRSEPATQTHIEPSFPIPSDLSATLLSMLNRLNLSSSEFISTQFDHEVQAGSVLKPLQGRGRVNSDASVTRPLLDSPKGVALSQGLCPAYSDIDSYHMAACAIDTAVRNIVAVGADPTCIALLDNFCWCSSTDPHRLGQLKQSVKACYDYATAYQAPFVSGKDSMFNDFKGFDADGKPLLLSIPPTLLISAICVMEDAQKAVSMDAKIEGDYVYVLGDTADELGASEYFAHMGEQQTGHPFIGNRVPKVDAKKNLALYQKLFSCIDAGLVASCVSVSRGGLATALARTAMAGLLGLDVSLSELGNTALRDDSILFSESQGRFLVTVSPANAQRFESLLQGSPHYRIGTVSGTYLSIKGRSGTEIVCVGVSDLLSAYKKRFGGW